MRKIEIRRSIFKGFNQSEKIYVVGQILHGVSMVLAATLLFVLTKDLTGDAVLSGFVNAMFLFSIGAGSLFAGAYVQRHRVKKTLKLLFVAKALIFFLIFLFLLLNLITFSLLLFFFGCYGAVTAVNNLLDIDTGGGNNIFSGALKKEQAIYLCSCFASLSSIGVPLLVGPLIFIASMMGPNEMGISVGFFICAALNAYVAKIYGNYLQPMDESSFYCPLRLPWHITLLETPKRLWSTACIVIKNHTISLRFILAAIESFLGDAIVSVLLPVFALDILTTGAMGLGILIATMGFGSVIASVWMIKYAAQAQKKLGLYRFIIYLSYLSLFAFVPSIVFWDSSSLWIGALALLLMRIMYDPLRFRIHALLQTEIHDDPEAKPQESNIFSLLCFLETMASAAGTSGVVWIFLHSGEGSIANLVFGSRAGMKIITLLLGGLSLTSWIGILFIKRQMIKEFQGDIFHEQQCYKQLETTLKQLELPNFYIQKSSKGRSSDAPAIVFLSTPTLDIFSLLREGGSLSPRNVFLTLDPSWFMQEMQPDHSNALYLKQGLCFDHEGNPTIILYHPPRPVHYFANLYTLDPKGKTNQRGIDLEARLNVPMSNSFQLKNLIIDKFYTRLLLHNKGVATPTTLAWLMPNHLLRHGDQTNIKTTLQFHLLPTSTDSSSFRKQIASDLEGFLSTHRHTEWAIKGSGPAFLYGYGLRFFTVDQFEEMVERIVALSKDPRMLDDGAILVDSRILPPALYFQIGKDDGSGNYCYVGNKKYPYHLLTQEEEKKAQPHEKKEWNLRIIAHRTPWNTGATSGIIVRAGTWGLSQPITSSNPEFANCCFQIEHFITALRTRHGLLTSEPEAAQFKKDMEEFGAKTFSALISEENMRIKGPGEPLYAQTDCIGFDVHLKLEEGKLKPYIVEVNDHDFFGQYPFDKFYDEKAGNLSRPWIQTMFARSRRQIMKEKQILLVGAGTQDKAYFLKRAAELEIFVILIDKEGTWAAPLVSKFIPVDAKNKQERLALTKMGIELLTRTTGNIDGITTYCEREVPFTALLAEELELFYYPLEAARVVGSKYNLYSAMKRAGLRTPIFYLVKDQYDLEVSLNKIQRHQLDTGASLFPMLLKPAREGVGSSVTVCNADEARAALSEFSRKLNHHGEPIFQKGTKFIIEELFGGNEWDIDLVMQKGKVLYSSITDNWPTPELSLASRDALIPCQKLSQMARQASIEHAMITAYVLGFTDGVLHIKGGYDDQKGVYLLELNASPGARGVVPGNLAVWGVDLVEMLFATALRIPIILP